MEEDKKKKQEELKRLPVTALQLMHKFSFFMSIISFTHNFPFFFPELCSCRKRDERLRRVFEAKVKEEQREEQKKKKIEQKMAQIDEKNEVLHKCADWICMFTSE